MNDNKRVILIDHLKRNQRLIIKDSDKTIVIFLTNQKDEEGEINIFIGTSDITVQILGIIIGSGKQKINLYTFQDHIAPKSKSDLFIKSVLFDEAKFNYKGLIKIEKDAQKSNAYQKNQNLLMSDKAWADSRPYLEILANDVRCTHGATIGKIDREQLYYLRTRGLNIEEATKLIISGYFNDVLDRIQDMKMREQLKKKMTNRLNYLFTGGNY